MTRKSTLSRRDFLSELERLIDCGVGWGQILTALDSTPDAIEKRLERAKRPDLKTAWKAQVRDGGSFATPGWLAARLQEERNHSRWSKSIAA